MKIKTLIFLGMLALINTSYGLDKNLRVKSILRQGVSFSSNEQTLIHDLGNIQGIIDSFKVYSGNQLKIDSAYIAEEKEAELYRPLNRTQVLELCTSLQGTSFSEVDEWKINSFYQIDSLKSVGKYEEYLGTLDLGMPENTKAYASHKFDLADGSSLLIWRIWSKTIDACPYAEGKSIMITTMKDNKILHTYALGQISSGADAPMWYQNETYLTVSKAGEVKLEIKEANGGESDEEGNEMQATITKRQYKGIFKNGVFTEQK